MFIKLFAKIMLNVVKKILHASRYVLPFSKLCTLSCRVKRIVHTRHYTQSTLHPDEDNSPLFDQQLPPPPPLQ